MKPSEMMTHYRDALESMQTNPEEWLALFQRKHSDCKEAEVQIVLQIFINKCKRFLEAKSKAKGMKK